MFCPEEPCGGLWRVEEAGGGGGCGIEEEESCNMRLEEPLMSNTTGFNPSTPVKVSNYSLLYPSYVSL